MDYRTFEETKLHLVEFNQIFRHLEKVRKHINDCEEHDIKISVPYFSTGILINNGIESIAKELNVGINVTKREKFFIFNGIRYFQVMREVNINNGDKTV